MNAKLQTRNIRQNHIYARDHKSWHGPTRAWRFYLTAQYGAICAPEVGE